MLLTEGSEATGKRHAHGKLEVSVKDCRPVVRRESAGRTADYQQAEREHLQHESIAFVPAARDGRQMWTRVQTQEAHAEPHLNVWSYMYLNSTYL